MVDFFSVFNKEQIDTILCFPVVIFRDIVIVRDDHASVQAEHMIYSLENGFASDDTLIDQYVDLFLWNIDKLHAHMHKFPHLRALLESKLYTDLDEEVKKQLNILYFNYINSLADGSFIPENEKDDKRLHDIAEDIKENLKHYKLMFEMKDL